MQTLTYVSVAPKLVKHPCASPPRRHPPKHDESKVIALAVTITLGIFLAIVVPLAAILPQKYVRQLPINIIVPLYSHPDPGAWDRLYTAILRHPDNDFTLIVNPSSGPGAPPLPSTLYIDAITRLHAYPNVKVIGYINTAGGDREKIAVMQEIETYAGWSKKRGLAMDGIFFDKTPTMNSSETVQYMKNISATVAHSEGFSAPRLVIQNAGTSPASEMIHPYVDVTIIFEGQYERVPGSDKLKKELADLHRRRENYGVLVHSMPTRTSNVGLRRLINSLKKDVQYVYITDLEEDVYEGFGDSWDNFMKLIWGPGTQCYFERALGHLARQPGSARTPAALLKLGPWYKSPTRGVLRHVMEYQAVPSMVILPLYIFPDIGAWEPLYAALEAYPKLQFTIIINPNSGPGSPPWWPNPDYVRELTRLTQYSNVRLLGYVATGYCKRAISDVLADVDAYAKWKSSIGVCLRGIFFDETPNLWCEEVSQYLLEITQKVKQCEEFVDDALAIHNPGTSVDPQLAETGPDATVVVEESYARFRTKEYQEWLAMNPYGWEKNCYIVHSVPRGEIKNFVMELKKKAKFVFVTDRTSGFYSAFGEDWEVFVRAMDENEEGT